MANFIPREEVLDHLKMFVFSKSMSSDVSNDWLWILVKSYIQPIWIPSKPLLVVYGPTHPPFSFKNNF